MSDISVKRPSTSGKIIRPSELSSFATELTFPCAQTGMERRAVIINKEI
ncbi:MAG: hypothetical protein HOJ14_12075 [Nitrospina sp.]|jgi:hypothetical protein|nr:hypothetical protein [Nitrospina sp.]